MGSAAGSSEPGMTDEAGAAFRAPALSCPEAQGEEAPLPLDDVVREHIEAALLRAGGKIHGPGGAGELLGVHPDTLRKKMKKMGIIRPFGRR